MKPTKRLLAIAVASMVLGSAACVNSQFTASPADAGTDVSTGDSGADVALDARRDGDGGDADVSDAGSDTGSDTGVSDGGGDACPPCVLGQSKLGACCLTK